MIGFLHFSAPPVIGGVEAVLKAHCEVFGRAGYQVTVIAGEGDPAVMPEQVNFVRLPLLNSQHPQILQVNVALEAGEVPETFEALVEQIRTELRPVLADHEALIVHNVFTKHFNLPLTVALQRLLDDGSIRHCISWCHDISWLSPNSRRKLHTGYPWQLLRDFRPDTTYVAVSRRQQNALAELFGCPLEKIKVVYNGVAPDKLLGLSAEGRELADRLGLLESDLVLLMPVRITRAKNIEYALRFMAEIKRRTSCPRMILTGPPDPHDPQSLAYLETLRQLRQELDVENEFRFIYDSGPVQNEPYTIGDRVVGDLYRLSDVLFMPSHREGFGMPVLEAGMAGVPVVCTDIPVANEIGGGDIFLINTNESPKETAGRILETLQGSSTFRLRRRVRLEYTWDAIFRRDIAPLLDFLDQIP